MNLTEDPAVKATDRRRGHRFQPPKAELAKVPALYATENTPNDEKVVGLHYFVGGCDWFVVEVDPETWRAFGFVNLGDPVNAEWGYFNLAELAAVTVTASLGNTPFQVPVERDCWWTPRPFAEVNR